MDGAGIRGGAGMTQWTLGEFTPATDSFFPNKPQKALVGETWAVLLSKNLPVANLGGEDVIPAKWQLSHVPTGSYLGSSDDIFVVLAAAEVLDEMGDWRQPPWPCVDLKDLASRLTAVGLQVVTGAAS